MIIHFIVLSAVWQNVFYIYRSPYMGEVFGVFDGNGTRKNDVWPDNWNRLVKSTLNHTPVFNINLTDIIDESACVVDYKLKIVFHNRTYIDTSWKAMLMDDVSVIDTLPKDVTNQKNVSVIDTLPNDATNQKNVLPIVFLFVFCIITILTIFTWFVYCFLFKKRRYVC